MGISGSEPCVDVTLENMHDQGLGFDLIDLFENRDVLVFAEIELNSNMQVVLNRRSGRSRNILPSRCCASPTK